VELIFIRHAQPEWVRDDKNVNDPPLTATGVQQAIRLAESTSQWKKPTAIIVSPTRRTRETAEQLCRKLAIEPTIAPWLEELRLPPEWEGAPAKIVADFFIRSRERSLEEWWEGIPGGESFHQFWERITVNLERFLAERGAVRASPAAHPSVWNVESAEERIVFVGHGGSNSAAISFLLGLEPVPWPWERLVSYHASVSRLKSSALLGGRIFGLRAMSDLSHLPPELMTR
jgi:2,3-bisphosphoglycerate-dependent phosphoglycerate mutase